MVSVTISWCGSVFFVFFTHPPPAEIYTLSLHDALPILTARLKVNVLVKADQGETRVAPGWRSGMRSEEHTSELQSLRHLVCRLLLEKKKSRGGGGLRRDQPQLRLSERASGDRRLRHRAN